MRTEVHSVRPTIPVGELIVYLFGADRSSLTAEVGPVRVAALSGVRRDLSRQDSQEDSRAPRRRGPPRLRVRAGDRRAPARRAPLRPRIRTVRSGPARA